MEMMDGCDVAMWRKNMSSNNFYKQLWNLPIDSEVKGLVWRVFHKGLQTKEILQRRNIIPLGSNVSCIIRNSCVETTEHLLFKSCFCYGIRATCYAWLGDMKALTSDFKQHFLLSRKTFVS
ncbi:hypothetical protein GmHk_02G004975 [Glycine max]|nr:hypothetical protein GmHk_02G004975 [Glycine max]